LPSFSFAQIAFKSYTVKDGLSSIECYHIIQDSKGYIWIATENGVSRFDGVKFISYTNSDGLSDNVILHMFEDNYKRLWFIPITGLPCYYENGKINSLELASTYNSHSVSPYFVHRDSSIWFSTFGGFIELIGKSKPRFIPHPMVMENRIIENSGLIDKQGNMVSTFWEDTTHQIYYNVKTRKTGIYPQRLSWPSQLKEPQKIWGFVTFISTIYELSGGSFNCINKAKEALYLKIEKELKNRKVIFIKEDRKKNIWVGTYDGGLFCFAPDFVKTGNFKKYFDQTPISSILIDDEENIWLTSPSKGVIFIKNLNIINYTSGSGIFPDRFLSVAKDKKGGIWFGMDRRRTLFLDGNNKLTEYTLEPTLPYSRVNAILTLHDHAVVFCTDEATILYKNKKFEPIVRMVKGKQAPIPSKSVGEDKENHLWLGTYNTFYRITPQQKVINVGLKLGLMPLRTTAIYCASDSSIWIGTNKGLFHLKNDTIIPRDTWTGKANNRIKGISELHDRTLCVVTDNNGLYFFKDGHIFNVNKKHGLSSNNCRAICIDEKDRIWIATNKGINKISAINFEKHRYDIRHYNTYDGLISNEVNALVVKNDSVWAATAEGFSVFKDFESNLVKPRIYITKLKINKKDTLTQALYHLPFDQNNLSIDFTGLSFKSQGNILYRYRMLGLDSTYNYTTYGSVQYPSLTPGNQYVFSVSVRSSDGVWSDDATVVFHIQSPFWQTWWFITGIIVLIVFFLVILFLALFKRLKRRELAKTMLNKRMAEMELKALRAQMNPHFTFNSMNSIQYYILNNDISAAQRYLSKFAKLIRYILDNSRTTYISIKEEIKILRLYLELESMRFEQSFEYEIVIDKEIKEDIYVIPSMLIQPYIENAIWHGLMPKGEKGKITLRVENQGKKIKCTVEDNGIGRKKAQELKEKSGRTYKSVGMQVIQERLEILNMLSNDKLTVVITDMEDPGGTKVEIFIPYSIQED